MTTINVPPILRMGAISAALAVVVATLATMVTSVAAQESDTYTPVITGDLVFEASAEPAPGVTVTLIGDGFDPGSTVEVRLLGIENGVVIERRDTTADAEGAVSHPITLPNEIIEGSYEAGTSGMAPDGAFIDLTTSMFIIGNVTSLSPSTTAPATTTATAAGSETTAAGSQTTGAPGTSSSADTAAPSDTATSTEGSQTDDATTPTVASAGETTGTTSDDGATFSGDSSGEVAAGETLPAADGGGSSAAVWAVIISIIAALGATAFVIRRQSFKANN